MGARQVHAMEAAAAELSPFARDGDPAAAGSRRSFMPRPPASNAWPGRATSEDKDAEGETAGDDG